MPDLPRWKVNLSVYGPIYIKNKFVLRHRKDISHEEPLYSDIEIYNRNNGVDVVVTAFAKNKHSAQKAALFFFGHAVDVLSFKINLPIKLEYSKNKSLTNHNLRREITKVEWNKAFKDSRLLFFKQPVFLRAIGWYRKALYTEEVTDKFLSFYNSLEIISNKYHPEYERKEKGSKSHMWETFKKIWGDCSQWPIIADDKDWIDENYEIRKNIAHGVKEINVEFINEVDNRLEEIRKVSYRLINDWWEEKLDLEISPDIRDKVERG
ncbi:MULTISPECIES: methylamine utilization protein MauJ [Halanaerobium]|uniref:Apea-like HEPN domain-containing protein n=1 Tax=Halanaerobium saccharolyticum TaxID=43595 RepID=A0A4R6LMI8_9FIRM|nr:MULTISPECIES: methylamine utilization protein MauJ [Halanaerobium]RCW60163.1 hypothetical protein DFR80_1086 [Halanaerobium sp. ST460_2HS_T2]TDO86462.1 hypothetical protein DFR79_11434 [Halanaerobium saccharolyticum]